jgi:hypothetical protein
VITETMIKAALDGKFYAVNFNTGRVVTLDVGKDHIPDHKPLFYDFVSDKPPVKEVVVTPPAESDELAEGPVLVDRAPTLKEILDAVSAVLRIGRLDLMSLRRAQHISQGRQIFYWFARYYTARSYPEIGLFCGKRDHSTVIHGVRKIDREFDGLRLKMEAIAARIGVDLSEPLREAA